MMMNDSADDNEHDGIEKVIEIELKMAYLKIRAELEKEGSSF